MWSSHSKWFKAPLCIVIMFSVAAMAPIDVVCSDKWNICVSYVFKFLLLHCDTVTLWHCQGTRNSQQSLVAPDQITKGDIFSVSSWWVEVATQRGRPRQTPGERESREWWLLGLQCSLTCLRPLWVRAEHSRYLTDRILFASFWPCSLLIGEWPLSARACRASLSSLRSILVPGKTKYF